MEVTAVAAARVSAKAARAAAAAIMEAMAEAVAVISLFAPTIASRCHTRTYQRLPDDSLGAVPPYV